MGKSTIGGLHVSNQIPPHPNHPGAQPMIPIPEILAILAATCLLPSLYRGAVQDLKEFKFAEMHFDSLWVNAAIILTIGTYISFVIEGVWLNVVYYFAISVVASLIFSTSGFRFGSGGDWRALCYIAFIAPFMLIQVLLASGACGIVQAVYWMARTDIDTPPMFRKIPFAVSIFCGYLIALVWLIVTVLG
jgi:hypothetical protein